MSDAEARLSSANMFYLGVWTVWQHDEDGVDDNDDANGDGDYDDGDEYDKNMPTHLLVIRSFPRQPLLLTLARFCC